MSVYRLSRRYATRITCAPVPALKGRPKLGHRCATRIICRSVPALKGRPTLSRRYATRITCAPVPALKGRPKLGHRYATRILRSRCSGRHSTNITTALVPHSLEHIDDRLSQFGYHMLPGQVHAGYFFATAFAHLPGAT